eukprot:TRINITY_DN30775_c0_g1_i1.p1 TRINITY_DN30775_c0_g1~~TRINITY_DN30775_c0_g1_i1.p1  ORF type:complete len:200 (+),score=49.37 TRINITY_DN30775_c0_g1_i1:38-637(+)
MPMLAALLALLCLHVSLAGPAHSTDTELEAFRRSASASGWQEDGPAAKDDSVKLSCAVKQQNRAELQKFAERVSDPNSKDYGKFLSKEEMEALTAPREEDVATVVAAFPGFEVQKLGRGSWVTAVVPVAFAEKLLGGTFLRYCVSEDPRSDEKPCSLRNPTAVVPSALHAACDIVSPLDDPLPSVTFDPIRLRSEGHIQ